MMQNNSDTTRSDSAREQAPAATAEFGKRRFPTVGDLFALLGIALGAQIVVGLLSGIAGLIMGSGFGFGELEPVVRGRFLAVTYFVSMAVALWGIVRYRQARGGGGPVARYSLSGLNPVLILWACAFMFAAGVVFEPLLTLLPVPAIDMGRGFWVAVTLVVFAPVLEELICRGVVLGSLRAKYGVVTAWLVSSLFFAVLHIQPLLVVNAFVIGLILGFIYIATGSIWASMILHAANNALAYVLMISGKGDMLLIELIGSRTLYVLIYIAALAVAAVSAWMVWRRLARLKREEKNPAGA